MNLNIKAYPEQIMSKLEYGFKDIEIQLYHHLSDDDINIVVNAIQQGANVNVIHSSLIPMNSDAQTSVSLKKILAYEESLEYVEDTFKIADICAKLLNHPVGVLLHNGFSDSDTLYFSKPIKTVVQSIIKIYENYKENTYILIENETVFLKDMNQNKSFREKGTAISQNFVINLFKKYGVNDVFAVVDTCHLMMDNIYQNRMFQTDYKIDWDKTFKEMKDFKIPVGLIHLSKCEKDGLGKDHGLPFDENSQKELCDILEAKHKYYPNAQITLEVYEDDYYAKPFNYITEMTLVNSWYDKKSSTN